MAKFRMKLERLATFHNVIEIEAENLAAAYDQARELANQIRRGQRSYELGMGKEDENPNAFLVVYSPKVVDLKEIK